MKKFLGSILFSPILWGGLATFGFYAAMRHQMISNPLILRYTAGHPVEYITVGMFFIGMAALFFKQLRLLQQNHALRLGPVFPPIKPEREESDTAQGYLESIGRAENIRGKSIHLDRLRKAMLFLHSTGRADELDDELRQLSDEDQMASERDYGMVKMFIWAIPILGFLGTVVGITMALGNLDLTELESSSQKLAAGLNVAFDTTALALTLVFFLYFSLFFVQRFENALFGKIDQLVNSELKGRFVKAPTQREQDELRIVRRMLKSVSEAFDQILNEQVQRWSEAFNRVEKRSVDVVAMLGNQLQKTLDDSLTHAVTQHARLLTEGEEKLLSETLTPYIRALKDGQEKMVQLQNQLQEEGKVFQDILRATGKVSLLEARLNENLHSLSEATCFSETVNSLATAIHLLYAKLGTSRPLEDDSHYSIPPLKEDGKSEVLSKSLISSGSENDEEDEKALKFTSSRRSLFGRKNSARKGKSA